MGDRSNIVIKDGEEEVFLYGHWMGVNYIAILATALTRGKGRWRDASYLARIVFCDMVRGDLDGETGYGIWASPPDNERPYLVVDCGEKTVRLETEGRNVLHSDTFEGFLGHLREFIRVAEKY
jgi:hypothetical protein